MEEHKAAVDDRPIHLMHIVDLVRRRFGESLRAELADHPYTDVRRSELRLLLLISPAGTSLTELAEITGVTKQSLSEFVERLQKAGYLTTETSRDDRRVKLIRPTERGTTARRQILAAIRSVEDAWQSAVGPERFDTMTAVLTELAASGSPSAPTSPPVTRTSGVRGEAPTPSLARVP